MSYVTPRSLEQGGKACIDSALEISCETLVCRSMQIEGV
jgi:hypothetical protein